MMPKSSAIYIVSPHVNTLSTRTPFSGHFTISPSVKIYSPLCGCDGVFSTYASLVKSLKLTTKFQSLGAIVVIITDFLLGVGGIDLT